MREFNVTGKCIPNRHYMVDVGGKIDRVFDMVERGKYY
jgi:hypothetical protein